MLKSLPPIEELEALLICDSEAGKLYWRERPVSMFNTEALCKSFNSHYAGKEALVGLNAYGYRHGKINHSPFYAHRVIWKMSTGEDPEQQIDHIDGDRLNNSIGNLRVVSNRENAMNMRLRSDNTSGTMGVIWVKSAERWIARIKVNGKQKHLGTFRVKDEAVAARKNAEVEFGYHANHGRVQAEGMAQ